MKEASLPALRLPLIAVLLISFGGGILNGIVGSGSGIVFLFLYSALSPHGAKERDRYSFAMTCVLIVSLVSLFLYPAEASSVFSGTLLFLSVAAGLLGGAAGAILKERVKTSWLNRAFALLTLYSGLSMVLK